MNHHTTRKIKKALAEIEALRVELEAKGRLLYDLVQPTEEEQDKVRAQAQETVAELSRRQDGLDELVILHIGDLAKKVLDLRHDRGMEQAVKEGRL